ncbi:endospore germination permease [Metabacillus fastidiosus]|uniref:endospore germination permease n=1 Tax=Metabacillus fastidiosus TaxID=1458 RepID=UPI002E24019C|nr:endospore germination permease [Metabacillus fastidiosus]MED4531205.1 endospore germination permease [Metabacillus fastidiosus]
MEQKDMITTFQMTLILMMVIGLQNHVIVIRPVIQTAGRDGWMSVLLSTFITLLWGLLLLFIQKGIEQEHLYHWLVKQVGKPFAVIACLSVYVYCVMLAIVTLKETIVWEKITFLQNTPVILPAVVLLALCILAAITSLRTIVIATFFLLFFVVILGFFVATTNLQVKDYSLLLPMLENGYSGVIKGAIYPGAGMGELLILIFLQHKLQNKVRYRTVFWNVVILTILTLGPLIGGIIEFGPTEAGAQRFTAFEEWGLVSLGRYIEHLDFLSIYQWLSGAFIRIAVLILITLEIFPVKKKKVKIFFVCFTAVIILILVVYPMPDIIYYKTLKNYILPIALSFSFIFSLTLGCIVIRANVRKKRSISL